MVLANFDWQLAVTVVFMWQFTVKKSLRGCWKLQLYHTVVRFCMFGVGLSMFQCCVHLETAWKRVWRDCQGGVHSSLPTWSWYLLPEGTIQFQEMPLVDEIPSCSWPARSWQNSQEFTVEQSGRGLWAKKHPWQRQELYHSLVLKPAGQFNRVMLRQGYGKTVMKVKMKMTILNLTHADESDGNDGDEDEARFHSSNELHLTSEALFLVGHQSKGSEAEE